MNPHDDPAMAAAQRFYGAHQGEHLERDSDRLTDRCAQHLTEAFCLTNRAALDVAIQVRTEIDAEGAGGFIDLEHSNAQRVVVRDTTRNAWHAVSVGELLQWMRHRSPTRDPVPTEGLSALAAS